VVATLYESQITARVLDSWKIDDFAVINAQRASPSATKLTGLWVWQRIGDRSFRN